MRTYRLILVYIVMLYASPPEEANAQTGIYTETYTNFGSTPPPAQYYSALESSPDGVTYGFYPGLAKEQWAGYSVAGTGDEGLYFANNSFIAPSLTPVYSPQNGTGNYLFNGYGGLAMQIDFSTIRQVYGMDFGFVPGSGAPSMSVTVEGFVGSTEVWSQSVSLSATSSQLIDMTINQQAVSSILIVTSPGDYPGSWYTMTNLSFAWEGPQIGGYQWIQEPAADGGFAGGGGDFSPAPEPSSLILGSIATISGLGCWWLRRRKCTGARSGGRPRSDL